MSTSIKIHDAEISIQMECPSISYCLELNTGSDNPRVTLFMSRDQWWTLRNALPKAPEYFFAPEHGEHEHDHDIAGEMAAEFYRSTAPAS